MALYALYTKGPKPVKAFLAQVVRKTPQADLHHSLAFTDPYGHTPDQRALNGYLKYYPPHVLETTIMAAISATKSGQMQLKTTNSDFYSTFESVLSSEHMGHTYHLVTNIPLKPGLAAKLIKDPRALIWLMSNFPTGVTFVKLSTAKEMLLSTPIGRLFYLSSHIDRVKQEHAEAMSTKSFLTGYAAILGGIDIVMLRGHESYFAISDINEQSWESGTTGAHGFCGKLTWRLILDPSNPNNLIVQHYGEGRSYADFVDHGNNLFAGQGFPVMGELFQFRVNNDYQDKSDDEFFEYLKKYNPDLYSRTFLLKLLMPQRLAALLNQIWRQPDMFNAELIEQQLEEEEKGLVVYMSQGDLEKAVNDKSDLEALCKQLADPAETAKVGIYSDESFVEAGTLQALFVPEEEIKKSS